LQGDLGLVGECIAPDPQTCQQAIDVLAKGPAQTVSLSSPPGESSSSSSQESQSSSESSSGSSG
jgi:hypothetical protein